MGLGTFAAELCWAVLAHLLARPVAKRLERLPMASPLRRFVSRRTYLRELLDRLHRMPFIYKGIETDVLNDFVEMDLATLDSSTLTPKPTVRAFNTNPYDILLNRKHVVLLGAAGIGKTTFLRHSLLQAISRNAKFLYSLDKPLPVYVPLKLVPNREPYPILRYIISSAPFNGDESYFHTVIETQGLFLCLDGYDEIGFTGTGDNYIQSELSCMFFGPDRAIPDDRPEVYETLARSRIWLTSRPQFIRYHPIRGPRRQGVPAEVSSSHAAVDVRGIGRHREALAQKIFDRYSVVDSDARSLLNTEYFIHSVDRANDKEVRDMSFNPLFLTVMCYNYAQVVLHTRLHDAPVDKAFDNLILECVDLLLEDIDEYKARQFGPAERAGVLNRRNEYVEEKRRFLPYFAAYSYVHKLSVFTENDIAEVLEHFLTDHCSTDVAQHIRLTFRDATTDRPSFVRQLIYCGLFVLVDVIGRREYFDFPHRRFREVLASAFFATPKEYILLLEVMAQTPDASHVELTTVLRRSDAFRNCGFQSEVLRTLSRELSRQSDKDLAAVSEEFVNLLPGDCDVTGAARSLIEDALSARRPAFRICESVLELYKPSAEDLTRLQDYVRQRCDDGEVERVALACSLLSRFSAESFRATVTRLLSDRRVTGEMRAVVVRAALTLHEPLGELLADRNALWDVLRAATTDLARDYDVVADVWNRCDMDTRLAVACFVAAAVREASVSGDGGWGGFATATGLLWERELLLAARACDCGAEGDGVPITAPQLHLVTKRVIQAAKLRFESFRRSRGDAEGEDVRIQSVLALRNRRTVPPEQPDFGDWAVGSTAEQYGQSNNAEVLFGIADQTVTHASWDAVGERSRFVQERAGQKAAIWVA